MNAELKLCNLVSQGMTLREAREKLYGAPEATEPQKPVEAPTEEPKKLTTQEKKEALTAEILAAGGTVPDISASVAKFREALTAATADELM